jgi:hypothetical protein
MHGVTGEFVRAVEPHTEADTAALLFFFLLMLGSIIGRGPQYKLGGDLHFTNLFAVIVAKSSKGRKGTSWGETRRVGNYVDGAWLSQRCVGGLSSGEGLIWAVRDPITEKIPIKEGRRVVGYEDVIASPTSASVLSKAS